LTRFHLDIPILHIGSWYDDDQPGTFRNFEAMQSRNRSGQFLIVGPWGHDVVKQETSFGDLNFGAGARIDIYDEAVRFFKHFLDHEDPDYEGKHPKIRYFVMGENQWHDTARWPPPETQSIRYYFGADTAANSMLGDGKLSIKGPAGKPFDTYTYDPNNATLENDDRRPVVDLGMTQD